MPYVQADLQKILAQTNGPLVARLKNVLDVEAPLSEEWLLKRSVGFFKRSKVTRALQEEFEAQLGDMAYYGIELRDGFFYLPARADYVLRVPTEEGKRELKYIAPEELAAGIRALLQENVVIERDGLARTLVKRLGFAKVTDGFAAQIERALTLLGDAVELHADTDTVRWKKEA